MPPKTSTPPKGKSRFREIHIFLQIYQMHPVFTEILLNCAFCANSQWKARLQRWKKTRRKRGGKKPKNPQWRRQGDVILINFLRPPTQTQPKANRQTYQAATIDSSLLCRLYESALLSTKSFYFFKSTIDSSLLYSLKPAALFYLYTRAIQCNISFFYFVVLHWT